MADSRSRILDAATHLFGVQGYTRTTVREIADRAGVTAALVHHHFHSKAELLHAVLDRIVASVGRRLSLAASSNGEGLGARQRAAIEAFVDWTLGHPDALRTLAMTMYSQEVYDAAGAEALLDSALCTYLTGLYEPCDDCGARRAPVALAVAATQLFGACAARTICKPEIPHDGMSEQEWTRLWRDRLIDSCLRRLEASPAD